MPSKKKKHNLVLFLEIGIIVIALALIILGNTTGFFDYFGDGMLVGKITKDIPQKSNYWETAELAVLSIEMDGERVYFKLKNNKEEVIEIDGFAIGGERVWVENFDLDAGETKKFFFNYAHLCDNKEYQLAIYYNLDGAFNTFLGEEPIIVNCI